MPKLQGGSRRQNQMEIFFSVGEPSGDLHGANLIRELRTRFAQSHSGEELRCVGYGGPRMEAEGAELHTDLTKMAVMGFFLQVMKKVPKFFRLAREARRYFREHRPDAVVLIDFPGFNWHIARHAKREGVPVFYYGTPQLWAWAPWRVKKMRRTVDHALCKLPFEEKWLCERGCNATHVGHPYFDELRGRKLDATFITEQRNEKEGPLVTILPGSRTQEVKDNFHWQLAAAERIRQQVPDVRFAVAAFKPSQAELCEKQIAKLDWAAAERPVVHVKRTGELIEAATCCLAVSGSVSLELLFHAKPTVILYHVSRFPFWLQKIFRRVRYITLVNLLTTDDLFPEEVGIYDPSCPDDAHVLMPEYLTCEDRSAELAGHLIEWLTDETAREALIEKMGKLREQVGHGGASERAAEYLLRELTSSAAQRAVA